MTWKFNPFTSKLDYYKISQGVPYGSVTYYLNQSVTQTPYKEFSSIVSSAVEQVVPLTVLAGATSIIAEFQTPVGVPNTTQIPAGLWQFFLHFDADTIGQNWIIRPTIYKRDLVGTETLLFTPDPEIVTNMSTITTMYISDGVFPSTTLLTTDRIVVKISMENTTGVSQTVRFRTEGSQHYSVAFTTLNQVIAAGSVTSVTGTAPIVSSGGTTPAISIPVATASANGYLSSSDWSIFSAKLGGSGTTNYLSKFTGSGTLGNSLLQDNGTSMSVNTAPNSTYGFYFSYSSGQGSIYGTNSYSVAGQESVGVAGTGSGTLGSNSIGGAFNAFNNTTLNIGVRGYANSPTVGTNIGAVFQALSGANNYAIQLQDGTNAVGKFLKSITTDGKANWSNITVADTGLTLTTTGTSGAATLVGSTLNIPNYATSSSGIIGIANTSGVYTYYATLSLAMTAAVSGNTIELFSDIVETGSVAIALKNGVKINGNGHTYTLSVNDNTSALTCASATFEAFNWKVVRTGRANGSGGYVLNCTGGTFKANGVIMQNTYGTAVFDGIAIYGLNAIGYLDGFSTLYENPRHYECIGESTGTGNGIFSSYSVNCLGIAISGGGIVGNGTHLNGTGISTSGTGISGQTFTGCIGISTSGIGASCTSQGRNCIGISTSGIGGAGAFYDSTLISSSNYGATATLYNSYTHSLSSVATNSSNIYNSTVRCLWDNVAGHCTSTSALGSREILNSLLEVTNASAYCITGYAGSTWKYSNNSFKGATNPVNTTNITQGITNTSDNQGNILV